MIANTTNVLIAGLVFLVIGGLAAYFKWGGRAAVSLPLLIGILLVSSATTGPLSKGKEKVRRLAHLDRSEVAAIVLQPTAESVDREISIVHQDTVLQNDSLLLLLAAALRKAKAVPGNYMGRPESVCRVQINLTDGQLLSFGMRQRGGRTMLSVNSEGESGWHFADLKANEFGKIIDAILKWHQ